MSMKMLTVEDTWINYLFSALKNKKSNCFNIAISKLTELPNEFEAYKISRISQIRPKFAKFYTGKIAHIGLINYITFRRLVRII